ncbi:COBRA-like protein 6 isoform X2 [Salvia miltiorrhiza]|uniref:COBRA-like protein 6 isoform X2 n=1 Tax=Salvia miltiorrhiza TaxID=226208 RepID=UPI0025AD5AC5|nr:COBRA-like protein 6 isoform X2 [Salvia miltiorrhiza]
MDKASIINCALSFRRYFCRALIRISIVNYQLFRQMEQPGWKLSWRWRGSEVIWNMLGAEATEQGNCSLFKGKVLPHCCEREPVIIDLLPAAPYNKQVANCCRGGILTSVTQDPAKHISAFQMHIGTADADGPSSKPGMPTAFSLGAPGYTCGEAVQVPPTKFAEDQGRRRTQAFETWNVTCTYSQFRASPAPSCCVSLSAFYNQTIVKCPQCSCACQEQAGTQCVKVGEWSPPQLQLSHNEPAKPVVQCTNHMCPIKVHWHIKLSYTHYWRVKVTVTNLNYVRNYSDWNLVVLHPNLRSVEQVFSFNYKPLNVYGNINDSGVFYGIQYYNDMLLQSGKNGNVQTEILLHKDEDFTFKEGWGFPRKISFNGQDCVMPSPDDYPRLPNAGRFQTPPHYVVLLLLLLMLSLMI